MKGIRILLACMRKADKAYNLISDNDKIVVGISGGKDSVALFYALHLYKKFSGCKFEIYPCIIDLGFDDFDPSVLVKNIAELGYNLEILHEKQVFQILKAQQINQKLDHLPCSICSRMKKAIINKYTNKIGANKVAFAHHKDDAIETLFLNEIYGGKIATFSPKMFLTNEKITFIRPFLYVREKDIIKTVKEENLQITASHCPNDKHTKREEMKNLLDSIYKNYPSSEDNFLTMLENYKREDVFYMHEERKIEGTTFTYKKVKSLEDYIDFKSYSNSKVSKDDIKNDLYLIYNGDKIVSTFKVITVEPRVFEIIKIKGLKKASEAFLIEIKKELYDKYNPCKFIED
ncbi:MAG: tRNA 2-thiocytidine(32) synthetase TtcA [Bacilli bacterium]|nr:tRNA 2-thiocytidine(32) synthetase TtcA [Bacilli bacterium]